MTAPTILPARPSSGTPGIQYFDGAAAANDWLVWIAPGGRPFDAIVVNRTVEDTLAVEVTTASIDQVNDGTADYHPLTTISGQAIDTSNLNNLPVTAARFSGTTGDMLMTLGIIVRL
jgi:hypothetical protein